MPWDCQQILTLSRSPGIETIPWYLGEEALSSCRIKGRRRAEKTEGKKPLFGVSIRTEQGSGTSDLSTETQPVPFGASRSRYPSTRSKLTNSSLLYVSIRAFNGGFSRSILPIRTHSAV